LPEAVFLPLSEGDPQAFASKARELLVERFEKTRALVVGPGLGQDEHATALLAALFGKGSLSRPSAIGFFNQPKDTSESDVAALIVGGEKPAVVDADALNWLSSQEEWWTKCQPNSFVLTPHVGEMSKLIDSPAEAIVADPVSVARDAASKWKQVVVLKYGHSVVTDGTTTYIAPDAPVSLATAGAGDVLAGMIGGLLAQGVKPLEAAAAALFIGPKAARRVEQVTGALGLLAGDLPLAIAEEIRSLQDEKGA
jgi:NAD(P)H-hydrate epimerase